MNDFARHHRLTLVVLALTMAYATVRYCVFGDVASSQLPLFVLNKAVSWSAVVLLLAGLWRASTRPRDLVAGRWYRDGFWLSGTHVLLSFALLGPVYYAKLYGPDARLTLLGGLCLLAGALATGAIRSARRVRLLAFALGGATFLHVAFLGAKSWPTPGVWPGGLPPITLLSALLALAIVAVVARSKTWDG